MTHRDTLFSPNAIIARPRTAGERSHAPAPRKTTALIASAAAAVLLAVAGCGSNPTSQQIGTGAGAVLGGAAGNAVFGGTLGTVGGAAAGALIGNELGKRQDEGR